MDSKTDHSSPITPQDNQTTIQPPNRRFVGAKRLGAGLLLLLVILVMVFFTSIFHGSAGNLPGLATADDDWTFHSSDPQAILKNPRMSQIIGEVIRSPEWQKLLQISSNNTKSTPSDTINTSIQEMETWLDGEIFVAVRWHEDSIDTPGPARSGLRSEKAFASITCVFRPRSSRLLALARAAFIPGIGKIALDSNLPKNARWDILDGIIEIANPAALSGNPAEKSPAAHGIAVTTVNDVIVVGTSFDQVRAKCKLLEDLDRSAPSTSPNSSEFQISQSGIDKIGGSFADLFGLRSAHFVRALHGEAAPERVKIQLTISDEIEFLVKWIGIPWAEQPLPELEASGDSLHLSLSPAEFASKIGTDLIKFFDAHDVAREYDQLYSTDDSKRPSLQAWLTEEKVSEISKILLNDQAKNLSLFWLSPTKKSSEDRPIIGVYFSTKDERTLAKLTRSLDLTMNVGQDLRPIQLPQLAGFYGLDQPHGAQSKTHVVVTNGPSTMSVDSLQFGAPKGTAALWRFQTTGPKLASLLHSLDEIRATQLERPTFARRLLLFRDFLNGKNRDLDWKTVTEITDNRFKNHKREALLTLRDREKAYGDLLKTFGTIRCEGKVEGDSTVMHIVIN